MCSRGTAAGCAWAAAFLPSPSLYSGGWYVPLQCPGDSQEGSVLVPLQGTWPSPPAQPSERRFLPVLWSPVLRQRLCSQGQQELQLPGC